MVTKKDVKDRSVFFRFNEETGGVLEHIKKILGGRGEQVSDQEAIRRLIDEGALRIEIKDQLGLHEDLEKLQKNPRLGLLNVQTRERAGEPLTLAELVFLSAFWLEAYRHDGVRHREWVRKEPVASLYSVLFWVMRLQAEASDRGLSEQHADFFERWGGGGELVVPTPSSGMSGDRWVSPSLATHICQMLSAAVESAEPLDMKRLNALLPRTARSTALQVALYGYWSRHKSSVLEGPSDEPLFPRFLKPTITQNFRVDPIQSKNGFTCGVSKPGSWIFSINSWVEWLEINEVISQAQDGNYHARAGRFTLYAPLPKVEEETGYLLEIAGVRLCFERNDFSEFQDALSQCSSDHVMLAFAEKAKDVYGQI